MAGQGRPKRFRMKTFLTSRDWKKSALQKTSFTTPARYGTQREFAVAHGALNLLSPAAMIRA